MIDVNVLPPLFGYVVAGVFGAIIGSFLNVVIHRVPIEQSIVFPNSRCPSCGGVIAFYDNIPVLSYLVLRAKCRHCKEHISFRYPAVELLTAALFIGVAWHDHECARQRRNAPSKNERTRELTIARPLRRAHG